MRNGNHCIVFCQLLVLDPAPLHRRKDHWRYWKQPLAITLDESSGGRPDSDNDINRPTGVEGAKILRK